MYYIVNHTDHIIAADDSFLALLSVNTLDDLLKDIARDNIEVSPAFADEVTVTAFGKVSSYACESQRLSTLLGEMTLIALTAEELQQESEEEKDEDEDDIISYRDVSETEEDATLTLLETDTVETADDIISLLEEEAPLELLPDSAESTSVALAEEIPLHIDIASISREIGISKEDYERFLKEYVETAITLEEDINSSLEKQSSQAIETLSHLSRVLHLSEISEIMERIQESQDDAQKTELKRLYHTLASIVTTEKASSDAEPEEEEEAESFESLGHIDLSQVKPIHFDFQLEAAANDLSLPIELIEEFVIDFIEQAHTETDKMLEAYEEGDLDKLQKIGHLLKGTSSNLRITALSDTLYKIQFCKKDDDIEALIKEYWGHFLSFEHQINIKLQRT